MWIQSIRLLYLKLHLQYNNNDCYIVGGLLVALSYLLAEKKIQFPENSLVVWVFFFLTVFCIWEAKAEKRHKEVKKYDYKNHALIRLGIAANTEFLQNSFIINLLFPTLLVVFITRELSEIQHCVLTITSNSIWRCLTEMAVKI